MAVQSRGDEDLPVDGRAGGGRGGGAGLVPEGAEEWNGVRYL